MGWIQAQLLSQLGSREKEEKMGNSGILGKWGPPGIQVPIGLKGVRESSRCLGSKDQKGIWGLLDPRVQRGILASKMIKV